MSLGDLLILTGLLIMSSSLYSFVFYMLLFWFILAIV